MGGDKMPHSEFFYGFYCEIQSFFIRMSQMRATYHRRYFVGFREFRDMR
jgi:hypothetical protein